MLSCYEDLAIAIVKCAVEDYRLALRTLRRNPLSRGAMASKEEVEAFFHSDLYAIISSVDCNVLIQKIQEEANT